jgi:hypothetical protein
MAAALRTETPESAGCLMSETGAIMPGDTGEAGPGETFAAAPFQANPFEKATRERLGFLEGAVARMERGDGAEAALREIGTFLLDLLTLVERDPGLELAADDLYEAAAILASGPDPAIADARRWRLLKDAARRLRERLDAAHPGERARRLGLC